MGKKYENINISVFTWRRFFSVILFFYPLRHIHWGLDLWDTGYNYANFQYMGLEHMDSMWLYSTYLANAVGNLLTKLPFADSLAGMNFYTGLFVSGLALLGFWFCTEKLHIPSGIAFLGEMVAISLCWCPTALLYNYLTYVLFLLCVILLYLGLNGQKRWYLFGAGVCLGANVLVRFPNLPEAALIVGVWAYAVIEGLEAARLENGKRNGKSVGIIKAWKEKGRQVVKYAWKRACHDTLWCLLGYLAALAVLFIYMQIRYGLDNYVEGILRLFAMTDTATDYKADSMIMGIVDMFRQNLYWIIRIGVFAAIGVVFLSFVRMVWESKALVNLAERFKGWKICKDITLILAHITCVAIAAVMLWWLYKRGFCSLDFRTYGAILWPSVTFLTLAIGIGVIRIFNPGCPKEEKLISGLMILVLLLTSIGSNNKLYPSFNNLFVAAPYVLWECMKFFTKVKEWRWKKIIVSVFPIKVICAAFLGLFLFQSLLFGTRFLFAEATGAQEATSTVENNEILKGVKMPQERAVWLQEISDYVAENDLQGREVILYGEIPSLSYYLQMPSAFNPWSDLRSYGLEVMAEDLQETIAEMEENEGKRPVMIVENRYVQYQEKGLTALEEMGLQELTIQKITEDKKWELLVEFMEEYNYEKTFSNEKFTMYE